MNHLKKLFIVARYTFTEIYKSKIMLNVVILGLAIAILSYIAAEFTYGVPARVALDVGLGLTTLSTVGIAIFMGSTLISKEIEQRTVYMTLSCPISRTSFLLGRIVGMSLIIALNIFLLGAITYLSTVFFGGNVDGLFYWVILFTFFEAMIMLVIVISLSLVTNTIITVINALTIYVIGHALSETMTYPIVKDNPLLVKFLSALDLIFPSFSTMNIKPYLLYGQTLEVPNLFASGAYGLVYGLLILGLSSVLFSHKSLD